LALENASSRPTGTTDCVRNGQQIVLEFRLGLRRVAFHMTSAPHS